MKRLADIGNTSHSVAYQQKYVAYVLFMFINFHVF